MQESVCRVDKKLGLGRQYRVFHPKVGCLPLYSCFRYKGEIRQAILQAKIHGSSPYLKIASELFLRVSSAFFDGVQISKVVYAPSSLWSRVNGKFDLAWYLASCFARSRGTIICRPPAHLMWSFKKRSHKTREAEAVMLESRSQGLRVKKAGYCVLVDDVVTTGETFLSLANCFPSWPLICLSLAMSRVPDSR